MTSVGPEGRHTCGVGIVRAQPRFVSSTAVLTKPSILPPSMSAMASSRVCSAPPLTRLGSWYGRSQCFVRGSGTHTVNWPFLAGSPSARGNVPKNESNDRFSCMMITTCRILWIPCSGAG